MFYDFDEACPHKERFSKDLPVIIYRKRDGFKSGGCIVTATKPASGADMEVTYLISNDYDIIMTIYTRQHEERGKDGGKARDKSGVINSGMLSSPSSFLTPLIFFHALKR